ncbi:NLR family CARD domain-containing protein 4-like [Centruroides vittatus]|uniref:NLR family CARD domain-containing protein 4-like n=1 Tax=Centruroides vittatus TaxID=120091 RepID=UPI00350E92D3
MAEAEASSKERTVVIFPVKDKEVAEAACGETKYEKEVLNVEKCNQPSIVLYKCINVQTGPKVENHFEESKANSIKKEDEERDELFDNCCQKIKEKYVTYFSYMRSFLWEGKRNDFPLKDHFVELTVQKADLFGNKIGEKISLNEIFAVVQDGHQTILVTGVPGSGKSTLCKKIAYDWASTDYLRHFQLTFIVILRELGDKSVKDALLDDIHELTDKNLKLQDKKRNVLVILDGFDEIVDKSKIIKFIREESFDISRTMTILVTSRPEAAEEIREEMKMRISIKGFSPVYQEKYIQLMFTEDESKARELIFALRENDFYREIAKCPLMLHMLCCLHQNGEMVKLETMADLYIKIYSLITERYMRKTNQKGKFKKRKYFVGEDLLMKLTRLEWNIKGITSQDLVCLFPNEDEHNFVTGLDILTLNSFSECDNIIRYSFVHRTYGEFLTAFSIYCGYISFPYSVNQIELLFLMGLYKDRPWPKKFLTYLDKDMFDPYFMLLAHKEIKLKRNWEQFCFHSKVMLCFGNHLILFQVLFHFYEFKEFYLCFHENERENETWKITLTDYVFRIIYTISENLFQSLSIYFKFTNVKYNLNSSEIRKSLNISEDEKLVALESFNVLRYKNGRHLPRELSTAKHPPPLSRQEM